VSGEDDFAYTDLAREYYGHAPGAVEAAAVAIALAAAPMYFYKRGKGRYRKAPSAALTAALASVERKKREAEQMAAWVEELRACRLPDAMRDKLAMLLYKPDKNTLEWKALAAASEAAQKNPVTLLAACGAIPSTHDYHFNLFLAQAFPQGSAFPAHGALPALPELPVADVRRVLDRRCGDDGSRRRISVRELANGQLRDRHPHRGAGARHRARVAARCDRPQRVCPPFTCPAASSRCCRSGRRDVHAGRGQQPAGALALRGSVFRRPPRAAGDAPQPRSGRRQSAPGDGRSGVRQRSAGARAIRRGPPSCALCGSSRNGFRRARQSGFCAESTTASTSIGIVPSKAASPVTCASFRDLAAARSTSSSPSS
jgi:hypothetical protein